MRITRRSFLAASAAVATIPTIRNWVAAQNVPGRYTLEIIEPLKGDDSSIAYAVSSSGWVTGISINSVDGTNRVIRYRDADLRDRSKGELASRGFAINKSAQITPRHETLDIWLS